MTPKNETQTQISNELLTNEMPSKTYKIDFERNRIDGNFIDGIEALKQAIYCILNTIRYEHIIYSHNYGGELQNIIGMDFDLAKSEIKRYIEEAILSDERFTEIQNFNCQKINSDSIYISFDVLTDLGATINVEQEVNV